MVALCMTTLFAIEAKRQAVQPYTAKQQALPYAKQIDFWDYQNDDARIVNSFFNRNRAVLFRYK